MNYWPKSYWRKCDKLTSRIFWVSFHRSFHLSVSSVTRASFSDNFLAAAISASPSNSCKIMVIHQQYWLQDTVLHTHNKSRNLVLEYSGSWRTAMISRLHGRTVEVSPWVYQNNPKKSFHAPSIWNDLWELQKCTIPLKIIIIIIIIIIITLGTRSDKIPNTYRNVLKMHFADFARSHTNNRAAAKYGNFIN